MQRKEEKKKRKHKTPISNLSNKIKKLLYFKKKKLL